MQMHKSIDGRSDQPHHSPCESSCFQSTEFSETPSPDSDSVNSLEGHSEPSWFKDIKFDDSDSEQLADEYTMPSMYWICL